VQTALGRLSATAVSAEPVAGRIATEDTANQRAALMGQALLTRGTKALTTAALARLAGTALAARPVTAVVSAVPAVAVRLAALLFLLLPAFSLGIFGVEPGTERPRHDETGRGPDNIAAPSRREQ
jgi:hypothetical protein